MKKCEHCGKENPDDAKFCVGCGLQLPKAGGQEAAGAEVSEKETREPPPSAGTELATMVISLVLQNGNTIDEGLSPGEEVVLGREDFLNYVPRGEAKYISRRHLKFVGASGATNQVKVEDMDSSNGTRLNGEALNPGTAYEINEGDELDLAEGSVVASFSIEGQQARPEGEESGEAGEPEPVGSEKGDQPRCPACGWYNPPGAKVCEKCGESL